MFLTYGDTPDNDHHEPNNDLGSSTEYSTGGYPDRNC